MEGSWQRCDKIIHKMVEIRLKLRNLVTTVSCLAVKRVAIVVIAVFISVAVNAQQGKVGVGFFTGFASPMNRTGILTLDRQKIDYKTTLFNVGIGGKIQYNVTDPIRIEGSGAFFFGYKDLNDNASIWSFLTDFSANAHYIFNIGDLQVYPLAGVAFLKQSDRLLATLIDQKLDEKSGIGLNIGGGYEQKLNDRFKVFMELKYSIAKDLNRVTLQVGAAFCF
jgi:opacity protein-like surface antigen